MNFETSRFGDWVLLLGKLKFVALMTTLPFATESTDTVVYGCKGCVYVSLYVCSYVSSAVKISTVGVLGIRLILT